MRDGYDTDDFVDCTQYSDEIKDNTNGDDDPCSSTANDCLDIENCFWMLVNSTQCGKCHDCSLWSDTCFSTQLVIIQLIVA